MLEKINWIYISLIINTKIWKLDPQPMQTGITTFISVVAIKQCGVCLFTVLFAHAGTGICNFMTFSAEKIYVAFSSYGSDP